MQSSQKKVVEVERLEEIECNREATVDELILEHRENGRKLARSILRKWRVRMPAEEIDSVVDLGLCEAAQRYSASRGASFMTFFFYHLRGHLVRSVARAAQANTVFLTLAQSAGIDTTEWLSSGNQDQAPVAPEYVLQPHRDAETPESIALRREKIELCRKAYFKLDELEQEIIARSFAKEQSLVNVAENLGYSRCHISRVKKNALDRMKGFLQNSDSAQVATEAARTESVKRISKAVPKDSAKGIKRRARRKLVARSHVTSCAKAA